MMNIDALEAAILNKDPDGVVAAISKWNEPQREAAREPFDILMLALGMDNKVAESCDLNSNHPDVVAKRERDGIVKMSEKDRTYDYDMSLIATLARYGIAGMDHCTLWVCVDDYSRQSAQIMADRRPPWWNQWCDAVTLRESALTAEFLALLYERGLWPADDFGRVAKWFEADLPSAMVLAPEATQKMMREIAACRNVVYEARKDTHQLFHASDWVSVIDWLRREKLLDASRLLGAMLDAFQEPFNQTERNGAVTLAKAAKADGKVLAEYQSRWLGLVADSQSSVAGFAVRQLAKIQKAGLLDNEEAIAALPNIFSHKPKTHAKTAVELLGRIAAEESSRRQAVEAVTTALMHPNKDVQKAALGVLGEYLRPDDDAAIDSIRLHRQAVAATLASDIEKLPGFAEEASSPKPPGKKQPAGKRGKKKSSTSADATDKAVPIDCDTDRFQQLAKEIPPTIRERLRLDVAIEAAGRARIDLTTSWTIRDMRILASAEPIRPIESVEELIEVTSAAVERCECADTADRIVGGIVRLYRERPKSFDSMTKSLRKRGCAGIYEQPQRGIVAGRLGGPFSLLIGAWLGVEPDEDDFPFLTDSVQCYLAELSQRVREGTATPLLSEATHAGGWIDPRVWIGRLLQAQADGVELFDDDLMHSLLRLTPDGRDEAFKQCKSLKAPLAQLAAAALGGTVKIDGSSSPHVWVTALRARDPWIDLSEQIAPEEQGLVSDELKKLPDVVYPADYQWRVRERTANTSYRDLVDSWPTQDDGAEAEAAIKQAVAQLLEARGDINDDDVVKRLNQITDTKSQVRDGGFPTAALHHLSCKPAPPYAYPYLATQWPMKLDYYWCLATRGLSKRVESGSSVEEPYGQFLLPLLEIDRPLTKMAARALWIATVGKDNNSRSTALEVWIALGETDRVDCEMLVAALREIIEGGWVKLNRIAEVFAEVSAVSPLGAWAVADVLEAFLVGYEPFPQRVAPLLEVLDECCHRLGRAVSDRLGQALQRIKSGKAKATAKSLMNRVDEVTADRTAAVTAALEARLARCRRSSDGERARR